MDCSAPRRERSGSLLKASAPPIRAPCSALWFARTHTSPRSHLSRLAQNAISPGLLDELAPGEIAHIVFSASRPSQRRHRTQSSWTLRYGKIAHCIFIILPLQYVHKRNALLGCGHKPLLRPGSRKRYAQRMCRIKTKTGFGAYFSHKDFRSLRGLACPPFAGPQWANRATAGAC